MSARRAILSLIWALSLAVAAGWGARAQSAQAPGDAVRFVQTDTRQGVPIGVLWAEVGGRWVRVHIDPGPGGIVPVH